MRKFLSALATAMLVSMALVTPMTATPATAAAPPGNGPLLVQEEASPQMDKWVSTDVSGPTGEVAALKETLDPKWNITQYPWVMDLSDDGSMIVYASTVQDKPGTTSLRVLTGKGDGYFLATVQGEDSQAIAISADNSLVAVRTSAYADGQRLYVMSTKSGATPKLIFYEKYPDAYLGKSIDFDPVTGKIAMLGTARIALIDPASGAVTDFLGGCRWIGLRPDFENDPRCSVFLDGEQRTQELGSFVFDFNSSGDQLLISVDENSESGNGSKSYVATMTRKGTIVKLLDLDQTRRQTAKTGFFSPDGLKAAIEVDEVSNNTLMPPDVFVKPLSGGAATKVKSAASLHGWLACPGNVCPKYSQKAATKLQGTVSSTVFLTGEKIRLTASLTTTPKINATGTITVLVDGKKQASKALTAADKNKLNFTLKPLAKGKHTVQMTFTKSPEAMDAKTGKVSVTVYEP